MNLTEELLLYYFFKVAITLFNFSVMPYSHTCNHYLKKIYAHLLSSLRPKK